MLVVFVGERQLGILANLARIENNPADGKPHDHHEHDSAQPKLRIARDADNALSDEHAEGVYRRGDVACLRADEHDHERRERIEAHGDHDGQEYGEERQGLLGHAEGGAAEGEQEHGDGDNQNVLALEPPHYPAHAGVDGAGSRDDLERATDDEHEGHHLGRGHDARDGRLQHRSGTLAQIDLLARLAIDERLVHLLVGTRHRHLAPVDLRRRERSRRNDPRHDRHDDHQDKDDRVGMRHLERALCLFPHCTSPFSLAACGIREAIIAGRHLPSGRRIASGNAARRSGIRSDLSRRLSSRR